MNKKMKQQFVYINYSKKGCVVKVREILENHEKLTLTF